MPAAYIYLASRSPRRQQLLAQIGVQFELIATEVDETWVDDESAADFVTRLALAKAAAGVAALAGRPLRPVLAADTDVAVDGHILGKPGGPDECLQMLTLLSGRAHDVYSAVALSDGMRSLSMVSVSRVHMRKIDTREIEAYWATGEPADKAGAYGIQGRGAMFVHHLEGSYSGVMGLPLFETAQLLREFGVVESLLVQRERT